MSTKTTFKRIALVTVAALGFGLLSVAPSSAAAQSDTLALSATATAISVGSAASTTVTQTFLGQNSETTTVTVSLTSGPAGNTVMPTLTAIAGTAENGLPSVSGFVGTMIDTVTATGGVYGLASAQWTLALPSTAIVGTYVIKVTPAITGGAVPVAAAVTWTVTVGAQASAAPADAFSYAVLDGGIAVSTGSTDASVVIPVSSGSAVAVIRVYPRVGAATTVATGSTTLVAALTGPGTITNVSTVGATAPTGARTVTTTNSSGTFWVYVYGDGTPGTSTVTLTMGTVVITKTVKFYGAAASVTSTLVTPVIAAGSTAAVGVVTAIALDAAGNPVPGASLWLVSGTPTVFASGTSAVLTTGSTGKATFDIVGLTAGTSTVTIQNVAAGSTATFSAAAVSVRVGSNVGKSVVMSLDKATYSQGEAAVLTVTIKDAAGSLVADGTYTPFSVAATSTRTVTGATLPGTSLVTTGSANGSLTYAINVPTTSGDFTISATAGSGWTGTFAATATVSASAAEAANAEAIAAAADAAAEATDAANAALDAANAAAEAADAATAAAQDAADAVAALSVQVTTLIASLRAQIRSLTNLVIRIQKKLNKKKK